MAAFDTTRTFATVRLPIPRVKKVWNYAGFAGDSRPASAIAAAVRFVVTKGNVVEHPVNPGAFWRSRIGGVWVLDDQSQTLRVLRKPGQAW